MLIFLGALPKPLHGMSSINLKMSSLLKADDTVVFNLVPSYAARLYPGKLFTLMKVLHLAVIFFPFMFKTFKNRYRVNIYFSIAGRSGKLFDMPFMMVCGLWAKNIFVHHHSFTYSNTYDALLNQLVVLGRGKIIHIALCEAMKESLARQYRIDESSIEVLSNAAFFNARIIGNEHKNLASLGFISNISFEKGIREFVQTFALAKKEYPYLKAFIAGPCLDNNVKLFLDKACSDMSDLHYLGAVYGDSKEHFFNSIDVLLFPSFNDAEPLTIYEAFASGVPVIAWARGCISEMIRNGGGQSIDINTEFVSPAIKTLSLWIGDKNAYQQQVLLARQRFALHQENMQTRLKNLTARISGSTAM